MQRLVFGILTGLTLGYFTWQLGRAYGYQERTKALVDNYNQGYRAGMLYAYDNTVICGASPEAEGESLAGLMQNLGELDSEPIVCGQ